MVLASVSLGVLLLAAGAFVSLKGMKFARFIIPIIVGILGFQIVQEIMLELGSVPLVAYGLAAVTGVLFMFGSYILYKAAIVLQFAALGFALTYSMFALLGIDIPLLPAIIGTFLALVIASLAIFVSIWNYLILVGTAFNGAAIGIMGLLVMFVGYEKMSYIVNSDEVNLELGGWASLILLVVYGVWAIVGLNQQIREAGGLDGVKNFSLSFFRFDQPLSPVNTKK